MLLGQLKVSASVGKMKTLTLPGLTGFVPAEVHGVRNVLAHPVR